MGNLVFDNLTICTTGDNHIAFFQLESPNLIEYSFHNSSGRRFKKIGSGQTSETAKTVFVIGGGGTYNCIFYKNSIADIFSLLNQIEQKWINNVAGELICDLGNFPNMRIQSFRVLSIKYYGGDKKYGCEFESIFSQ